MTLYNDNEPFVCAWLRELIREGHISQGVVDAASIINLRPADLARYERVHLFAGIGGWDHALSLAGWPPGRPVWTGSCPCQPYSTAGKGRGNADARDLWPVMFDLVRECRPQCVFGEQVEGAVRHGWLDRVCGDMEAEGYTVGAVVLGAHSVGSPHIRQRLYWVAHHNDAGRHGRTDTALTGRPNHTVEVEAGGEDGRGVDDAGGVRCVGSTRCRDSSVNPRRAKESSEHGNASEGRSAMGGMGDTDSESRTERNVRTQGGIETPRGADAPRSGFWDDYDLVCCSDGKSRRVEPGTFPLAHGVPNRVGKLRGYGNAIVPQVAAAFVRAFLDAEGDVR